MVGSPYFFTGRESELCALICRPDLLVLNRQLRRWAACRGMDPDAFHPDEGGRPDDAVYRPLPRLHDPPRLPRPRAARRRT